jgi:hypothetical protein
MKSTAEINKIADEVNDHHRAHLAFSPAVEELRPPVVDAHDLLHLLERRVRADVAMERQRKAFARILTAGFLYKF